MLTKLELDKYSREKYERMIQEQHLAVLYASQTGTAQEAAERIWRKSKAYGYIGPVLSMDEYSITNLIFEYFVIFVCSTTGNGDPPDNMLKAWRFLKQINLPVTSLYKLKFGVLGLGDSSYIRYNYVAKKLFRRLIQLGAKPILDIGLCDYQHDLGHEAVMEPWISKLFSRLPRARHFIDIGFFVPRYKVSLQDADHKEAPVEDKMADNIYLKEGSNELLLRVHSNVRTTHESHFQDVRLIELKKKDNAPIKYLPGNVFNVRPRNSKEDVDDLFSIFESHNLNIKPDQILVVEELHKRMSAPYYLSTDARRTMRQVAEQVWDLRGYPSQYAFSLLAGVSEDKLERDKCTELSSPSGYEEWLDYSRRPKRTVLEVLRDFHKSASKMTIEVLFEFFSHIRPRSFSIAGFKEDQLDLLVAVVNYPGKLAKPRLGLCSNWLKDLQPGDEVLGSISCGVFRFPKLEMHIPLIMIGPGTGLAPFRSEIQYQLCAGHAGSDILHLFFGCRYKDMDFHCRKELEHLASQQKLSLYCAFSRDQDEKIYVQDKIRENNQLLWDLITMGAYIFISGNSKNMPNNVKQSLVENVLSLGLDFGAEEYLKKLEEDGKLQVETW